MPSHESMKGHGMLVKVRQFDRKEWIRKPYLLFLIYYDIFFLNLSLMNPCILKIVIVFLFVSIIYVCVCVCVCVCIQTKNVLKNITKQKEKRKGKKRKKEQKATANNF